MDKEAAGRVGVLARDECPDYSGPTYSRSSCSFPSYQLAVASFGMGVLGPSLAQTKKEEMACDG